MAVNPGRFGEVPEAENASWPALNVAVVLLRRRPKGVVQYNAPLPVPPDLIESGTMEMQIFVRNNIHEEGFEEQNSINYMEICSFPNEESGYTLEAYSASYDSDSRMVRTSPFPYMICGAVLHFQHRTEKHPPFAVALFEIDLAWDPDWRSQDFVGVYNCPPGRKKDFTKQYFDWFENGRKGEFPGKAELTSRDGLEAWKLDHEVFVRVSVRRDQKLIVGSIAIAEIFAGTSWERDIVKPGPERDE